MPYVDSGKAVYPSIFFSSKEKELKRMDTLYRFGEVSDFHVNGFNVIYKSWPINLSLWIKLEYTHAYTFKIQQRVVIKNGQLSNFGLCRLETIRGVNYHIPISLL